MIESDKLNDVIVVGAGISGLTVAKELTERGLSVLVLDKSRGVGGRMATRKYGEAWFDHGAQFVTAHESEFRKVLKRGEEKGELDPWFGQETGHIRYRGEPGMTAMAKGLCEGIRLERSALVEKVTFDNGIWTIKAGSEYFARHLVIAYPVPQALELFAKSGQSLPVSDCDYLATISYHKCLAVLLTLKQPSGFTYPGIRKYEDPEPIELITDNQVKGISRVPTLTVHAGPEYSNRFYETREPALIEISSLVGDQYGIQIADAAIHGWKYARRINDSDRLFQSIRSLNLNFCGDSFGPPRIEGAFLSAKASVPSIIQSLENSRSVEG